MRLRILLFSMGALVAGSVIYVIFIGAPLHGDSKDNQAEAAVMQLWSADESERQAGKEKLIELGPKGIPLLVALLQELASDGSIRYMRGKEREGVEAHERLKRLMKIGTDEEVREALYQASSLTINWRLRNDVCELLGRLHAEEAIPTLIDMMGQDVSSGNWETMSPEMHALVQIGLPAVPKLIDAIETAETKAVSTRVFDDDPIFTEEVKRRMIKLDTLQIQVRAAMVLGRIGDDQALPALEKLQNTTDSEYLVRYVKEAEEKIKKKAN